MQQRHMHYSSVLTSVGWLDLTIRMRFLFELRGCVTQMGPHETEALHERSLNMQGLAWENQPWIGLLWKFRPVFFDFFASSKSVRAPGTRKIVTDQLFYRIHMTPPALPPMKILTIGTFDGSFPFFIPGGHPCLDASRGQSRFEK